MTTTEIPAKGKAHTAFMQYLMKNAIRELSEFSMTTVTWSALVILRTNPADTDHATLSQQLVTFLRDA